MDTEQHHSPTFRSSASASASSLFSSDTDESLSSDGLRRHLVRGTHRNNRKRLTKQLSQRETSLQAVWEKRRRHIRENSLRRRSFDLQANSGAVTDEDLAELKGCIDLGFGFNEEEGGQGLCNTLPALDLYFAVNRHLGLSVSQASSPLGSPRSPNLTDSWKICSPGDDPQNVKTRLRHWAQVVACSARQCS